MQSSPTPSFRPFWLSGQNCNSPKALTKLNARFHSSRNAFYLCCWRQQTEWNAGTESSALVSCQFVMEITHSHVSVCTAITEILCRNINISKAALTPSARGSTVTQLLGKLCTCRFVFISLKNHSSLSQISINSEFKSFDITKSLFYPSSLDQIPTTYKCII